MKQNIKNLMRVLQFTDSAFPVGGFSFSNGLETAAHTGLVHDASTLEAYTRSLMLQAASGDAVAALHAYRAVCRDDYTALLEADRALFRFRLNEEARLMLRRMGRKLVELGTRLYDNSILYRWMDDIRTDAAPGTYPVAQGAVFALGRLSEEMLFASHQYGVMNMVLNAALRCVKVSHYDTQRILFRLGREIPVLYEETHRLELKDMHAFAPQADILAAMHEKGSMRMFMN